MGFIKHLHEEFPHIFNDFILSEEYCYIKYDEVLNLNILNLNTYCLQKKWYLKTIGDRIVKKCFSDSLEEYYHYYTFGFIYVNIK